VGRDKGSLTEQQTKQTVTTTVLIRRIHNTNSETHRAALTAGAPRVPEPGLLSPRPAPRTQHGGRRCRVPCSVWPGWVSPPGCVRSWHLVKISPVLADPRTICCGLSALCFLLSLGVLFSQSRLLLYSPESDSFRQSLVKTGNIKAVLGLKERRLVSSSRTVHEQQVEIVSLSETGR